MIAQIWNSFNMGSPEDMSNYITAVIHEGSFDKVSKFYRSS